MTFDELMVKYLPLIAQAARARTEIQDAEAMTKASLAGTLPADFDALVLALEADLAPFLDASVLRKGAVMAADDLVSRFSLPNGSGAAFEGMLGGSWSEVDSLDPSQAEEPAPPPVVLNVTLTDEEFDAAARRMGKAEN